MNAAEKKEMEDDVNRFMTDGAEKSYTTDLLTCMEDATDENAEIKCDETANEAYKQGTLYTAPLDSDDAKVIQNKQRQLTLTLAKVKRKGAEASIAAQMEADASAASEKPTEAQLRITACNTVQKYLTTSAAKKVCDNDEELNGMLKQATMAATSKQTSSCYSNAQKSTTAVSTAMKKCEEEGLKKMQALSGKNAVVTKVDFQQLNYKAGVNNIESTMNAVAGQTETEKLLAVGKQLAKDWGLTTAVSPTTVRAVVQEAAEQSLATMDPSETFGKTLEEKIAIAGEKIKMATGAASVTKAEIIHLVSKAAGASMLKTLQSCSEVETTVGTGGCKAKGCAMLSSMMVTKESNAPFTASECQAHMDAVGKREASAFKGRSFLFFLYIGLDIRLDIGLDCTVQTVLIGTGYLDCYILLVFTLFQLFFFCQNHA